MDTLLTTSPTFTHVKTRWSYIEKVAHHTFVCVKNLTFRLVSFILPFLRFLSTSPLAPLARIHFRSRDFPPDSSLRVHSSIITNLTFILSAPFHLHFFFTSDWTLFTQNPESEANPRLPHSVNQHPTHWENLCSIFPSHRNPSRTKKSSWIDKGSLPLSLLLPSILHWYTFFCLITFILNYTVPFFSNFLKYRMKESSSRVDPVSRRYPFPLINYRNGFNFGLGG